MKYTLYLSSYMYIIYLIDVCTFAIATCNCVQSYAYSMCVFNITIIRANRK